MLNFNWWEFWFCYFKILCCLYIICRIENQNRIFAWHNHRNVKFRCRSILIFEICSFWLRELIYVFCFVISISSQSTSTRMSRINVWKECYERVLMFCTKSLIHIFVDSQSCLDDDNDWHWQFWFLWLHWHSIQKFYYSAFNLCDCFDIWSFWNLTSAFASTLICFWFCEKHIRDRWCII